MKQKNNRPAADRMEIEINGKKVNLIFQSKPNLEAADFIKKVLLESYKLKVV